MRIRLEPAKSSGVQSRTGRDLKRPGRGGVRRVRASTTPGDSTRENCSSSLRAGRQTGRRSRGPVGGCGAASCWLPGEDVRRDFATGVVRLPSVPVPCTPEQSAHRWLGRRETRSQLQDMLLTNGYKLTASITYLMCSKDMGAPRHAAPGRRRVAWRERRD